ncbi:phosphoribosylaminoimidazole carboxylase, ATPase subunit [Caldalkalibacillus thermarum TA2.A1]|uniref:N5-carboxyaminoimidazole ribonucleotide synthase n=1 Tax=Caldalkalibacillus thermarum (strain TA2.A1) TaxID=986075 RepID=F5L5B4_CALTT|nr:5-(carboxyamino)imidazole ribonucleotide synthase [Caldalkalibacillus thermarum]EGL83482.1 phosphoribosylaminoimidazole carboxylase, ATPase subunit [Caldalkalibacillus thermarum TA2.A1]QZT34611.1 5-(carboxyamino)imidazole ribonucleotide synthase [Caldalkalibacillus thermarum TA2.A1]
MSEQHTISLVTQPKVIRPPAVIGILGGGQLGRMLALSAREMGYQVVTLDPTANSPCGQVADKQIVAPFDSLEGARQLARDADVLTYEFENISARVAHELERDSYLPQGYRLLYSTQNRLREKVAIESAGVAVAPYVPVRSADDLYAGLDRLGYPALLKTAEGGYDGKGQFVLRTEQDIAKAERQVRTSEREWVLEQFVPFVKELSVIVARNPQGELRTFPVAENIHRENILHLSIAPARVSEKIKQEAAAIAVKLAEAFQLVGLLAIELFLLEDGRLLVNELAPRPHNSGHYTQQACPTSQFEQHVRAVCNLPLGDTKLLQPTVMVNILGEHLAPVLEALPRLDPAFKLHLYGKKEATPKRKMGHLNVSTDDLEQALAKIKGLKIWNMEGIS